MAEPKSFPALHEVIAQHAEFYKSGHGQKLREQALAELKKARALLINLEEAANAYQDTWEIDAGQTTEHFLVTKWRSAIAACQPGKELAK